MKLKQHRDDGPNSEATPGSPYTKPSLWKRRRDRRAARKRARAQVTGARMRRAMHLAMRPHGYEGLR
jgi:hypothetical protein